MAQVTLDGHRIGPADHQQAGAGVAQAVGGEPLRQSGAGHGPVPDRPAEALVAEGRPPQSEEDQGLGVDRDGLELASEELDQECGDPNPERALYRARPSPDVHVADGEYTDPAGHRTAVEVELTVKAADRLRRIIGDLTLEYDRVLYVTGDGRVAAAVRGAVQALGEAGRVEIADLAVFALLPEAR